MQPVLDDHLPMLFFAINCVVLAFYYGAQPSLWFLFFSLPTAMFFFTKPFGSFSIVAESDIFISLVYFTLVGLAAIMIERLRREQYKSSLLARVSDSRYRLLVEADEDRRTARKTRIVKNAVARKELSSLAEP